MFVVVCGCSEVQNLVQEPKKSNYSDLETNSELNFPFNDQNRLKTPGEWANWSPSNTKTQATSKIKAKRFFSFFFLGQFFFQKRKFNHKRYVFSFFPLP